MVNICFCFFELSSLLCCWCFSVQASDICKECTWRLSVFFFFFNFRCVSSMWSISNSRAHVKCTAEAMRLQLGTTVFDIIPIYIQHIVHIIAEWTLGIGGLLQSPTAHLVQFVLLCWMQTNSPLASNDFAISFFFFFFFFLHAVISLIHCYST